MAAHSAHTLAQDMAMAMAMATATATATMLHLPGAVLHLPLALQRPKRTTTRRSIGAASATAGPLPTPQQHTPVVPLHRQQHASPLPVIATTPPPPTYLSSKIHPSGSPTFTPSLISGMRCSTSCASMPFASSHLLSSSVSASTISTHSSKPPTPSFYPPQPSPGHSFSRLPKQSSATHN